MDNNLRQIGPHLFKCTKCGDTLSSGIINLSSHWADCSGKDFMRDLKTAAENKTLDIKLLNQIKEHHEGEM